MLISFFLGQIPFEISFFNIFSYLTINIFRLLFMTSLWTRHSPVCRCFGRGAQSKVRPAGHGRPGREGREARHLPILMRSRVPLSLVSLELYIIVEWELHRWISFVQPIKSSFRRYQPYHQHSSRRRQRRWRMFFFSL